MSSISSSNSCSTTTPSSDQKKWSKDGIFPIHDAPDLIIRHILSYLDPTDYKWHYQFSDHEQRLSLLQVNRSLFYRSVFGVAKDKISLVRGTNVSVSVYTHGFLIHARACKAIGMDVPKDLRKKIFDEIETELNRQWLVTPGKFRESLRAHQDIQNAFKAEIASRFIKEIEEYFRLGIIVQDAFRLNVSTNHNKKFSVTAEDFHHVFGRALIQARYSPVAHGMFIFQYARHIAIALDLINFNPNDEFQNLYALLTFKLTKELDQKLLENFLTQRGTVRRFEELVNKTKSNDSITTQTTENDKDIHLYATWGSCGLLYTLPPYICGLTHITKLRISYQLNDLPLEFWQLENLTSLDISFLHICHLLPFIKKLTNLETLDIGRVDQVPSEIGKLTKLQNLTISHPDRAPDLPAELGQLKSLTTLKGVSDWDIKSNNRNILNTLKNKQPPCKIEW